MKISKLLNKKFFLIIVSLLIALNSFADENPVDIWNIEKKKAEDNLKTNSISSGNEKVKIINNETSIYNMQFQKETDLIKLEQNSLKEEIKIIGLYDPEDYGLNLNMWTNSDGDQLRTIFSKIDKLKLSRDASEILNISLLTNAYQPNKNMTEKEFLKIKSDWLIKNSDLKLIEEYLIKNQIFDLHPELSKFLLDEYLSNFNLEKSCEILSKNLKPINDEYLTKFKIYCLIDSGKKEEAQVIFDLKKELGFENKYFENKINYLFGYIPTTSNEISEKSILDFHLAHKTNVDFSFEPSNTTDKIIWKYLSSANLLDSFKEIEISELEKISTIEKAVHNKNYPEKDLFELYKRFQFNINQLLNANEAYKTLSSIEARALIYQKVLLESELEERLRLLKVLKKSFKKDNIEKAFDEELKIFLNNMDPSDIPDNLYSFYYSNIKIEKTKDKKIKFNNDIMYQSKLLNYFNGDYSDSRINKEVNNFLKKIKKNKKYFFSKKDIIFLESLKYDGIKIEKKYNDLYEIDVSEIPTDIKVMINNDEKGAALLRLVEVIGQDELERIDDDTLYFIITTLNQLNINFIRNKILLKVLPLKV
tara:strand:+ start:152 stop:1924 length:1773 start_codon:yes stop_codon:yes gene_type:complete